MTHHVSTLFEQRAEMLDFLGSSWNLDDAKAELAAWIDLARYKLTDVDIDVLVNVGALLHREAVIRQERQGPS